MYLIWLSSQEERLIRERYNSSNNLYNPINLSKFLLFSALRRYNWQNARYLKCTTWWSDICIQYKRMSSIRRIISQSAVWDQVSSRVVMHVLPCKEMYRKMVWLFGKHPFSLNKFRLRMHTHRKQARWLWNVI